MKCCYLLFPDSVSIHNLTAGRNLLLWNNQWRLLQTSFFLLELQVILLRIFVCGRVLLLMGSLNESISQDNQSIYIPSTMCLLKAFLSTKYATAVVGLYILISCYRGAKGNSMDTRNSFEGCCRCLVPHGYS